MTKKGKSQRKRQGKATKTTKQQPLSRKKVFQVLNSHKLLQEFLIYCCSIEQPSCSSHSLVKIHNNAKMAVPMVSPGFWKPVTKGFLIHNITVDDLKGFINRRKEGLNSEFQVLKEKIETAGRIVPEFNYITHEYINRLKHISASITEENLKTELHARKLQKQVELEIAC